MRLYIAGPMTGLPNLNYDAFNRTAHRLAQFGHEVYNPASTFNGAYLELPYDIWLREAIRLVSMVNGMVLLPRWWKSKGALTEIHIGLSLGMPFFSEYGGELTQLNMEHRDLINAMRVYYLGEESAATNDLSESAGGNSRQAESGEDHPERFPLVPASGVGEAFFRSTIEGRLAHYGGGHG